MNRNGYRTCYGCGRENAIPPDRLSSLCETCTAEAKARVPVHATKKACSGCGHTFYNDWERVRHEVHQAHRYRAWTPADAARKAADSRVLHGVRGKAAHPPGAGHAG